MTGSVVVHVGDVDGGVPAIAGDAPGLAAEARGGEVPQQAQGSSILQRPSCCC